MSPTRSGEPEDSEEDSGAAEDSTTLQASPSSEYKTRGKIEAGPGTGVLGSNTSTSGVANGVEGFSDSANFNAAGVRGESDSTHGIWAESHAINGIRAISHTAGYGGIFATHESTSGVSPAVIGRAATSGYGAVEADNIGGGSGLLARGDPAVDAQGAVDAQEGYRGAVGASAYFPNNWSVTSTAQKIPFNTVVADQRGEFSTSDNWFECAYDGTYVVELGIESVSSTTGSITIDMNIDQGNASDNPAEPQGILWDFDPQDSSFARTFTKTIYGLKAGNRIYFEIDDDAGTAELTGSPDETFMSVRQVGGGGTYTSSPQSTTTSTAANEADE